MLYVLQSSHHDRSGDVVAVSTVTPVSFLQNDVERVAGLGCVQRFRMVIVQDQLVVCMELHQRRLSQCVLVQIGSKTFGNQREVQEAVVTSGLIAQELFWQLKVERMMEGTLRSDCDISTVAWEHRKSVERFDLSDLPFDLVVLDMRHHDVMQVSVVFVVGDVMNGDIPWPHQSDLSPDQWILCAVL